MGPRRWTGKESRFYSRTSREEGGPVDSLILVQRGPLRASDLPNSRIMNLCYFEPLVYGNVSRQPQNTNKRSILEMSSVLQKTTMPPSWRLRARLRFRGKCSKTGFTRDVEGLIIRS